MAQEVLTADFSHPTRSDPIVLGPDGKAVSNIFDFCHIMQDVQGRTFIFTHGCTSGYLYNKDVVLSYIHQHPYETVMIICCHPAQVAEANPDIAKYVFGWWWGKTKAEWWWHELSTGDYQIKKVRILDISEQGD